MDVSSLFDQLFNQATEFLCNQDGIKGFINCPEIIETDVNVPEQGSDMVFIGSVLAILIITVIFLITYLWFLKHKDKFLHLIIFSSEYDQLKSLDGNKQITFSEANQLYNSTKFLSTQKINFPRLQRFRVKEDQETADDIYYITIKFLNLNLFQKVDKVLPGFTENVSYISRENAFKELSKLQEKEIDIEITISPRFKVDSLEDIAHYA